MVDEDRWPVIARAESFEGEYAHQSNRTYALTVRKHPDGRMIVHGSYVTRWQGERDRYAGVLVTAEGDVVAAIHQVAEDIGAPEHLSSDCVASLPSEELQ
jgi:hypothetical protein